jgi:polyisoprenoid-binding protein YceI
MSFEWKIERITRGSASVCKGDHQGGSQFTALSILWSIQATCRLHIDAVADEAEASADEAEYDLHLSSQTLSATRLPEVFEITNTKHPSYRLYVVYPSLRVSGVAGE